jgi:hypothetical protein
MAEGKIDLTGVRIPTCKELYQPVLEGIAKLGIEMLEERIAH